MFSAQYLPSGATVFSPWFERQGDFLRATADLAQLGSGAQLVVEVFTKNKEDTSDGTNADSGATTKITLTTATRGTTDWGPSLSPALKELVRYKYTVTTNWVLFRMLTPVWFNAVKV